MAHKRIREVQMRILRALAGVEGLSAVPAGSVPARLRNGMPWLVVGPALGEGTGLGMFGSGSTPEAAWRSAAQFFLSEV